MATKFLDPGGDASFSVAPTTSGGLWATTPGTPTLATDFVHGNHVHSIKFRPAASNYLQSSAGVIADAGTRFSFYIYLATLPASARTDIVIPGNPIGQTIVRIRLTSSGGLELWEQTNQIGSSGTHTLAVGSWYRISLAYTATNTTTNRFELFVDGESDISVTNATLTRVGSSLLQIGNRGLDTQLDFRISDIYVDNLSSLIDTGDIWVTAKRPVSNGTLNEFTTQVGSGGSGYGSGHSPQINERPVSTTNGWSGTSAQTEEFTIESASAGDEDISGSLIIDYMGWIYITPANSSTTNALKLAGSFYTITESASVANVFTAFANSTTYPAGNTDIGYLKPTAPGSSVLHECGIVFAHIPALKPGISGFKKQGVKIIG